MDAKLLLHHDEKHGNVVVLEAECHESDLINDYGPDLERWPMDLGAYGYTKGLMIWEGKIDDDNWSGDLRDLTGDEATRLWHKGAIWL